MNVSLFAFLHREGHRWVSVWILCLVMACPVSAWALDGLTHFEQGLKAFKQKNFSAAQTSFNDAILENPSDALSHYYLGLTNSRLGKSRAAIADYQRAIRLDPQLPGVHLSLGIAYFKSKTYPLARKELALAAQSNPNEGSPYFFLGLTQQQLGEYDQSLDSFQKAASLDPELSQSSWYYMGVAHFHNGSNTEAHTALERSIAVDENSLIAKDARDLMRKVNRGIPVQKDFSVYGGLGFLYDDNLTSNAQDLVSKEGDAAAVIELGGSYQFWKEGPYSAEAAYDLYQSLYLDENEFDLQAHNLSLSGTREVDQWDLGADYILGYNRLGGSAFLVTHTLSFGAGRTWGSKWYSRASYILLSKNFAQDVNDPRDGVNHSIGFEQYLFFKNKQAYAQLGYRLMDEDTSGSQFSYVGHEVTLTGRTPTRYEGKLTGRYQLLWKDFDSITPSIGAERLDRRHTFQITWTRMFQDLIEFKFDFQHIESDSNLPAVDYSENIVFFGAMYKF